MTRSRRSCNAVFFDCSLATAQFVINRITSSSVGEVIDTVVIGAGHAGLALSCYLSRKGTEHVVLERGQVGERWRTERWELSCFPISQLVVAVARLHLSRARSRRISVEGRVYSLVGGLRLRHPRTSALQYRGLESAQFRRGRSMEVATARGDIRAKNVVVATGPFQAPKIPVLESRTATRPFSDTLARLSKSLSIATRCHIGCRQRRVRYADR